MAKKLILKTAAFVLAFFTLLSIVSQVLVSHDDYRNYQWIAGFYEEREDSLDAVYIGGSNVYSFWAAPLAWEKYGITVYPFACNSQPLAAAEYLIKEARKTQPDALFLVSINGIGEITEQKIHYLADYFPMSANKATMIRNLSEMGGFSVAESLEFYFPLLRYHSRWNSLTAEDFNYTNNGLKGGSVYSAYLQNIKDVSSSFRSTASKGELEDHDRIALEALMDYCDAEDVNVLFVTAPQIKTDEYQLAQFNTINNIISTRGYPILNMMECIDDIGLDLTRDYYNESHTNIHGAIKTTDYLSKYLIEHYTFENKKGIADYADWDLAYELYMEEISPYAMEVEWDSSKKDNTLPAPKLEKVATVNEGLTIAWKPVEKAEGYLIYRKWEESGWELVNNVDRDTLSYLDENVNIGMEYTYTVMSYRWDGNEMIYGLYDIKGLNKTAVLPAPKLVSLEGEENNLALTWKKVKGADGYIVYRRLPSKSWIKQADVGTETTYVDTKMLKSVPYDYRVRAYQIKEDESLLYGIYTDVLSWLPEHP